MDLFQLKCFVSVIDCKSFTDAAYENVVSQSSLSKHISKLEDELGVTLIDRSRRSAVLTLAGREFEPYARRILNEEVQARNALKQFRDTGSLHIGCVDHMGRVGLTAPISSFLDQYPNGGVSINMERGPTNPLMESLLKGQLDMAIIAHIISPFSHKSNIDCYDLNDYHTYTLVQDEYHAVVNENHPFAKRKEYRLSWEELSKERLVILDHSYGLNGIIRESFSQVGLTPKIAFECDQVDAILGMVEEGFGVSILSKKVATMAQYRVVAVPMQPPIRRNTMLVVRRDIESRHLLAGRFVRHIVQYYESQQAQQT